VVLTLRMLTICSSEDVLDRLKFTRCSVDLSHSFVSQALYYSRMATTRFFILHFLLWGLPLFCTALSIPKRQSNCSGTGSEDRMGLEHLHEMIGEKPEIDIGGDTVLLRRAAAIVG
jgi:hypothetical protein